MSSRKALALLLTIAMVFSSFSMVAADTAAPEVGFADMPDNWSTVALSKAVENGLLKGYTNGDQTLIKADNPLTRAELAAVVNRAFASETEGDISKVTDVAAGAWYAKDMAKAVKMGTFALDTKTRPDDKITRQEAFAVLARAFKLTGADATHKALDKFSDKADIATWALKDLDGLAAAGYVQGNDGKLNPKANITRAEFGVVMDNLVKQYIDEAGTVTEVVAAGNVMVRAAGVTLKDVTVKGDLIIADGVGDGDVTLDSVTVEGRTVVRGGGENSIIIKGNSDLGKIIVAKVDGVVRIVVEGNADVEIIYVDDGSDDIIVVGTIGTLEVAGNNITVTALDATITNGTVSGNNSKIILSGKSKIKNETVTGAASDIVEDDPPAIGGGGGGGGKADLTAHTAALAAVVEADYTAHSWSTYQVVVAANVVTVANTQAEVDAATLAITAAQADLVFAGQADLDAAKAAEALLDEADYVDYSAVTAALALPETTNAEVVAKTTAINAAIANLQLLLSYNGSVTGQITANESGEVNGTLDFEGTADLIIAGNVTGIGNLTTFTGTVTGSINGTITAQINANGIDTLSGTIELTSETAADTIRIIGIFGQTGIYGDFAGQIITGAVPTYVNSIEVTSASGSTVTVGETMQLAVDVTPEGASSEVIWSVYVNDRVKGSIDNAGVFTAISEGTVTVIAKALDGSLKDAIFIVTVSANKETLTAAINAEYSDGASRTTYALNASDYTSATWSAYTGAITAAIAVEAAEDATQEAVDEATAAISTAKSNLVLKKLATVAQPVWSDYTITWTDVANAKSYAVSIYKDGDVEPLAGFPVAPGVQRYNMDFMIERNGFGSYTADVTALADTGAGFVNGETSQKSEAKVISSENDLSGFNVALAIEGSKTKGVQFNLSITNAKTILGNNVDYGALKVIVTSNVSGEGDEGVVFDSNLGFTNGNATVPITLTKAVEHTLTVEVTWVTDNETVLVTVIKAAGPAAIAENFAGTYTATGTSITLTGLAADATGLEAAVAIDGTIYGDYIALTVDENGIATITGLVGVTNSTKVKVRIAETATNLAGADKVITTPTTIDAVKTGEPVTDDRPATYQLYVVQVDSTPEDTLVYRVKPDGTVNKLEIVPDLDGYLNIYFRISDTDNPWSQQEGDHTFLIRKGNVWYKTVINYTEAATGAVINTTQNKGYEMLQEAIDQAEAGDTIKLFADVITTSGTCYHIKTNMTIDLNSHEISGPANGSCSVDGTNATHFIRVVTGTLTVDDTSVEKDGSIFCTYTGNSGAYTVEINAGARVVLNAGTLTNGTPYNYGGSVVYMRDTAEFTMNGGTVNGVKVESNKRTYPIFMQGGACKFTMTGGTVTSDSDPISFNGTVSISGGELAGVAGSTAPNPSYIADGSYCVFDGTKSTISETAPAEYTANINGKLYYTSSGGGNLAIAKAANGDTITLCEATTAGKVLSALGNELVIVLGDGGSYSGVVSTSLTGHEVLANVNENATTYTVAFTANSAIAEWNGQRYATAKAALDAAYDANSEKVVLLLKDSPAITGIKGGILDLNGKKIQGSSSSGVIALSSSSSDYSLRIIDSEDGGQAINTYTNKAAVNAYYGTITIEAGTYIGNGTSNALTASAASGDKTAGTFVITGGTFSSDPSVYCADGYVTSFSDGVWVVSPLTGAVINTTQNKGYETIQAAIADANEGDSISVAADVYNLTAPIVLNKPVTLIGNRDNPASVILNAPTTGDDREVFQILSDDVTIQGFTIQGSKDIQKGTSWNSNPGIAVGGDKLMLVNKPESATEYSFNYWGFAVKGTRILDNIIRDNSYGIFLFHSQNVIIDGNEISANTRDANTWSGKGIEIYTSVDMADSSKVSSGTVLPHTNNISINDNKIYGNELFGIELNHAEAYQGGVGGPFDVNVRITNNEIYNNGGPMDAVGQAFDYARGITSNSNETNVTVTGNKIYGHTAVSGARFRADCAGIRMPATSDWVINNNEIYGNTRGIYAYAGAGGIEIGSGNNIHDNAQGIVLQDASTGTIADGITFKDNNLGTWSADGIEPGNIVYLETPIFNGKVSGAINADEFGTVNGTLDFNGEAITITGQVTGTGNLTTFIGTVSGAIQGNIEANIDAGGIDTLSGLITNSGAAEPVRIIGTFPQTDVDGDFRGEIITGPIPNYPTSMTIMGGNTLTVGETLQMTVTSTPQLAAEDIAWSVYVNHRDIASINAEGLLSGNQPGTVTIIVKSLDGSLLEATKTITVTEAPSAEDLGYVFNASIKTITGYTGSETELVIPSSFVVNGVSIPVEGIGYGAFNGKTALASVVLPNTLKSISGMAFAGCTGLTIFTIPDSVTSLDTNAFKGCSNLETITIGSGVTYLTNSLFEGCSELNNVTIPSKVTLIGIDTFKDCVGLTNLTIEGNARGTNGGAFSGCSDLTTVTIGSGVTSIGNYLFHNHAALTSITIPEGVTELGQFAFSGTGLTSITIPSSLVTLGNYVFQNCKLLEAVVIPDTVTSLGTNAFNGCTILDSVTIGSGLTEIKEYTFAQCPSLTSIVIPNNITSIGLSAFIGTWASGAFTEENLSSITIGSNVKIDGEIFGTTRDTFRTTYATNSKVAGTYTFADGSWSKEQER